ncbi:MAG: HNH endonuclease [Bdellovibrionota bacterium]
MNHLKSVSSDILWEQTKSLVKEERRLTTEILWHLREIQSRELHLKRGYPSLHEFCVKELGYSDGSAYRRIESMKMLTELPELEKKIQEGSLTLSSIASVASFVKNEKKQGKSYSREAKRDLLLSVEGKSRRQAEELFAQISPQPAKNDYERPISATEIEIRMTIPKPLAEKLERIRQITSHKNPDPTHAELLEMLADAFLKTEDRASPEKLTDPNKPTRYIPLPTRQTVKRVHASCTYVDPKTGRRCGSRYFLQIDHIHPFARGGSREKQNLTLLCGAHNRLKSCAPPGGARSSAG